MHEGRPALAFADALPMPIAYIDATRHYRFCNKAFGEFFERILHIEARAFLQFNPHQENPLGFPRRCIDERSQVLFFPKLIRVIRTVNSRG